MGGEEGRENEIMGKERRDRGEKGGRKGRYIQRGEVKRTKKDNKKDGKKGDGRRKTRGGGGGSQEEMGGESNERAGTS